MTATERSFGVLWVIADGVVVAGRRSRRLRPSFLVTGPAILLAAIIVGTPAGANAKQGGGNSGNPKEPNSPPPMALEYENYHFRVPTGENSCLGEDDWLEWKASGSLAPGESFTYVPMLPGCLSHPAAITVTLSWEGSELELSSVVPDNDYTSLDSSQKGQLIVAPSVGTTAQLCMFPHYDTDDEVYPVTVTNVGDTVATNLTLDGRSDNDWSINYYVRCLNADADLDGWNDSLEHTMAALLYPMEPVAGVDQPKVLWGSNYLKVQTDTWDADDEVDVYPPDVNDDGLVDFADTEVVSGYLGQGNGITLEEISPNAGTPKWFHENHFAWRRYDLDGDGYVSQSDVDIVASLVEEPAPMLEDAIAPTARVTVPADGDTIPRGEYFLIRGHVWDNAALSQVEYLVDGKSQCSVSNPLPAVFGYESPLYYCWWETPKRRGSYEISIRAYDTAGNVTTSEAVTAQVQ